MDLKDVSSKLLIEALMLRSGSRSIEINKDEIYKVQVKGNDETRDRYIRGQGKVMILEIEV